MKRFGANQLLSASVCLLALLFVAAPQVQAQTYTVIHSFAGAPNDGAFANGELVQDLAGNLYGTTNLGGSNDAGTIFMLDPSGVVTILHSFTDGDDGGHPQAGLIMDSAGNLYGTATTGGTNGEGTVFELDTTKTLRVFFGFGLGDSGGGPWSRLVTIKGEFYGVASRGGDPSCAGDCGIIYKVSRGGTETVLYRFTGGPDGAEPQSLFRDAAGDLYGVATSNSGQGFGAVWMLDATGVFTVLHSFTGGSDGGQPMGRVIRDANGNIHGTTSSGGDPTCNCGVVFRLDSNGNETVIHKFFGFGGGSEPFVGPIDVGGVLYGTTLFGGDLTCPNSVCGGVLYQIGKAGKYTVLHRFGGPSVGDGYYNFAGGLSLGTDGSIYGATWGGGTGTACEANGCGTIFKYTP
jgi:uncharacterized repeat protein (TIGR03803 family)